MNRPDNIPAALIPYIDHLESEVDRLSATAEKSMTRMYRACDKQLGELAGIVDRFKFNDSILFDKDDKSFDRLLKIMIESKGVMENLTYIEQNLELKRGNSETQKRRPLVEERAASRSAK